MYVPVPESNELTSYGLAISLAYPSGEEGDNSSIKWFLPAFATLRGRGEGVGTQWPVLA